MPRNHPKVLSVSVALVAASIAGALTSRAPAQENPADIRIVTPVADKAAGTVTLPGAFWTEHSASWVEVALCGRPSDFLHETVLSVTTTRSLLQQALRDIGCRDGDAWVDGVADFPRLRGDRLLVLVTFSRNNKEETWSLDELLTFMRWGVSLGPYGFMFKGDPDRDRAATAPATMLPAGGGEGGRILRDDPQMALVFKGLQSMTQSFADHPLAYIEERWEWEQLNRSRNPASLPNAVFESNGKIPVTLVFKKVSEEQLLTQSAAVWHDADFKAHMLKQIDVARQIDKAKAEYWRLHEAGEKIAPGPEASGHRPIDVLAAEIARDYAALDAAWSGWAVEHVQPRGEPEDIAAVKAQAALWGQYMAMQKERAAQLATAAAASRDFAQLTATSQRVDDQLRAQTLSAQGRALEARSRALAAESTPSRDYWQQQWTRINDPKADDVWARTVRLHLALVQTRLDKSAAGVAYGQAQQVATSTPARLTELQTAFELAHRLMVLADARLALASVEFEISKRRDLGPADPDLAPLLRQRDNLAAQIKELEAARP